MLISCPNCKTTFAVPAKYIGETGRKVKCSKCTHIWHQEAVSFDDEKLHSLLKVEAKPSDKLPAVVEKIKFKMAYAASIAVLLVLIFMVQVLKKPDEYSFFAQKLNIDNFEGLRFHNFKVDSEIVDKRLDFYLKGQIINISEKTIHLPIMKVKALSKGGRLMAESTIAPPQETLEPFASIDVAPEITHISGNADKLEISFENWIEAALR